MQSDIASGFVIVQIIAFFYLMLRMATWVAKPGLFNDGPGEGRAAASPAKLDPPPAIAYFAPGGAPRHGDAPRFNRARFASELQEEFFRTHCTPDFPTLPANRCYECDRAVHWLAPDSRCGTCTRYTPEDVQ